jgi:hypothetical protein
MTIECSRDRLLARERQRLAREKRLGADLLSI